MASLLGEDGRGYELAKKLESCGVWRTWLGDANYVNFMPFLASPSLWESFMTANANTQKTKAHLQLQLRARALLFDKATVSLFLRSPTDSSSIHCSALNPNYLQLHPDDVYFSLEEDYQEFAQTQESSIPHNFGHAKAPQSKALSNTAQLPEKATVRVSSAGPRATESDIDVIRHGNDDFPETWYSRWSKNHKASRLKWIAWLNSQRRLPFGEREFFKRTPEGMSLYINHVEKHKRQREAFEDRKTDFSRPKEENAPTLQSKLVQDFSLVEEECFFPEIMFPCNCVPDRATPCTHQTEENPKVEFVGILDTLPQAVSLSPMMIERFGMRPEDLNMAIGRNKYRGKNRAVENGKPLGEEQAFCLTKKATIQILKAVGFEGATEVSLEVLSQFITCHIHKISRILKVLTDSYRKQCSSMELLKMLLHTAGYSNLVSLAEYVNIVKDTMKVATQNVQQHPARDHQTFHHNSVLQSQQILRQMHQVHMLHSANPAIQQQLDKLRQRPLSIPQAAGMISERERGLINVKVENTSEPYADGNFSSSTLLTKQPQFKQQQMAMASQLGHQYKSMGSIHVPQHSSQSTFNTRTPPVKVEGFQELMGGDMSMSAKHELEDGRDNKLTSPSK